MWKVLTENGIKLRNSDRWSIERCIFFTHTLIDAQTCKWMVLLSGWYWPTHDTKNCNHAIHSVVFCAGFFWPRLPCSTSTAPPLNFLNILLNHSWFTLFIKSHVSLQTDFPFTMKSDEFTRVTSLAMVRQIFYYVVPFLCLIQVPEMQLTGINWCLQWRAFSCISFHNMGWPTTTASIHHLALKEMH